MKPHLYPPLLAALPSGGNSGSAVMSRPRGDFNLFVFGSGNVDVLTGPGKPGLPSVEHEYSSRNARIELRGA